HRPERAQDRAEPQIRLADVRASRDRDRARRRYDVDVVRPRRRQGRPRHGRPRREMAQPQADSFPSRRRFRQDPGDLRRRADRQSDRIRRRGRRRYPAIVARAQAAARGRGVEHGLRDARTAAGPGACPDGATRHLDRPADAVAAVRRLLPEGRKIRRAFVADDGCKLVSADYSQIELRLLAEIADIAALKTAFRDGLDIHAMTASEMFGVPVKGMPGEIRRRAKAINFGIIYGISAFGLANQLAIPREEAGAYIKKYFERFPGIRDYMEETKAFAKKNGYVLTLFGRKCHYPDITAGNPSLRSFNERAAINARLQGSA